MTRMLLSVGRWHNTKALQALSVYSNSYLWVAYRVELNNNNYTSLFEAVQGVDVWGRTSCHTQLCLLHLVARNRLTILIRAPLYKGKGDIIWNIQ